MTNIFLPLLIGGLIALFATGVEWEKTDKWNLKLFLKAWFYCVVAIAVLMLPSTVSDYNLWKDFPAQMIIDRLL